MSSKPPVAVVTGASSGIGAATAKLLAKNGYTVIAGARRLDRLEALTKADSNIEVHQLDVTDQTSVDNFVKAIAGREVDLLVNNAGGAFDSSSVLDSDPAVWAKSYEVNVIGAVRMTKALAPSMIKAGKGHISSSLQPQAMLHMKMVEVTWRQSLPNVLLQTLYG